MRVTFEAYTVTVYCTLSRGILLDVELGVRDMLSYPNCGSKT